MLPDSVHVANAAKFGSMINSSDPDALEVELSLLRERVAELEAETRNSKPQDEVRRSAQIRQSKIETENARTTELQEDTTQRQELETLQSAFEDINLGIRAHSGTPNESFLSPRPQLSQQMWLLPSQNTSLKIVRFALNELGWIHCALRASVFWQEHETFWTSLQVYNFDALTQHSWMATYFAVLAVSVCFILFRGNANL